MSSFTPVSTFDGNEREWSMKLGMLDWDDTRIVFTKRELLNFLKYMGTSVDPNFNNISKLPKYATFGKMGGPVASAGEASTAVPGSSSVGGDFVPTRRVREAPGGKSSISFVDNEEEDALSAAPSKAEIAPPTAPASDEPSGLPAPTGVPSRRVRDPPGGKDSLKQLWDAPDEEESFIPTRRVRDQPGGRDNIGNFY